LAEIQRNDALPTCNAENFTYDEQLSVDRISIAYNDDAGICE
jgi:hypothetical protein